MHKEDEVKVPNVIIAIALVVLGGLIGWLFMGWLLEARAAGQPATPQTPQDYVNPGTTGPYQVGRIHLDLTRGGDRKVPLDIWYPAEVTSEPKSVYDLVFTTLTSPNAFANAPIKAGPFPIITFSHGLSTISYQSYEVMEHWASHGFVVVSPTHAGNDVQAKVDGTTVGLGQTIYDRTGDLRFAIDVVTYIFSGHVDSNKIVATGHSMGGWAAFSQANGYVGFDQTIAADPRIDAVLAISPATALIPDDQLDNMKKPLMVFGGSVDTLLPVVTNSTRMFNLAPSERKFRVDVDNSGHGSPSNVCELRDALVATVPPVPPVLLESVNLSASQACDGGIRSSAEARAVLEYYGVAFFQRALRQVDAGYPYLSRGLSRKLPVCYWRAGDAQPRRGKYVAGCLPTN